jgi:predicted DNA-binding transcriptional regulator AlpA
MPTAQSTTAKKRNDGERDRRNDRVVSLTEICKIFGKHRSTIYRRRRRDARFPKPVNATLLGGDAWESDIYAYLDLIQREPYPPK